MGWGDGEGEKGKEERLIRIIGSEAQDNVPHWLHHNGVPPHRHRWECLITNVLARIFL